MTRKKKIIRIRRNPFNNISLGYIREFLKNPYLDVNLSDLINIHIQGYYCEDCGEKHWKCECEKCDDCGENRCMCILEDLGITAKTSEGRNELRKIVWEFVRYMKFNDKDLIPDKNKIKDLGITKEEKKFLQSLTPNSKFPKYTKLMKRLFEID